MTIPGPFLSVIVPAHQAAEVLPQSLSGLRNSDLPRGCWELIVVDDASTDDTALVAAQHADTVVRLAGKPRGPAYARNRGCEASRGDVIVFVDADVCVHTNTLRQLATLFGSEPDVSAAFGAYDAEPYSPGLVSQYRNLLHRYVHLRCAGEAETFWAGLGAIRRSAFVEAGMFDEWHYSRPQIEDIELGRRLRRGGHRILLCPEVQGTHLKRWTLGSVLATDFKSRGVPWMRLLLQEGSTSARTLNICTIDRWCTALVGAGFLGTVSGLVWRTPWALAAAGVAVGAVVLSNLGFYRFLRRHRGLGFALAVVPLHLLYYLSNGASVFFGWLIHHLFGEPRPPVEVEALAEVGVETWPPAPTRLRSSLWNSPKPEVKRRPTRR